MKKQNEDKTEKGRHMIPREQKDGSIDSNSNRPIKKRKFLFNKDGTTTKFSKKQPSPSSTFPSPIYKISQDHRTFLRHPQSTINLSLKNNETLQPKKKTKKTKKTKNFIDHTSIPLNRGEIGLFPEQTNINYNLIPRQTLTHTIKSNDSTKTSVISSSTFSRSSYDTSSFTYPNTSFIRYVPLGSLRSNDNMFKMGGIKIPSRYNRGENVFKRLTDEEIVFIFFFLKVCELSDMFLISKRFNNVANSNEVWKQMIKNSKAFSSFYHVDYRNEFMKKTEVFPVEKRWKEVYRMFQLGFLSYRLVPREMKMQEMVNVLEGKDNKNEKSNFIEKMKLHHEIKHKNLNKYVYSDRFVMINNGIKMDKSSKSWKSNVCMVIYNSKMIQLKRFDESSSEVLLNLEKVNVEERPIILSCCSNLSPEDKLYENKEFVYVLTCVPRFSIVKKTQKEGIVCQRWKYEILEINCGRNEERNIRTLWIEDEEYIRGYKSGYPYDPLDGPALNYSFLNEITEFKMLEHQFFCIISSSFQKKTSKLCFINLLQKKVCGLNEENMVIMKYAYIRRKKKIVILKKNVKTGNEVLKVYNVKTNKFGHSKSSLEIKQSNFVQNLGNRKREGLKFLCQEENDYLKYLNKFNVLALKDQSSFLSYHEGDADFVFVDFEKKFEVRKGMIRSFSDSESFVIPKNIFPMYGRMLCVVPKRDIPQIITYPVEINAIKENNTLNIQIWGMIFHERSMDVVEYQIQELPIDIKNVIGVFQLRDGKLLVIKCSEYNPYPYYQIVDWDFDTLMLNKNEEELTE